MRLSRAFLIVSFFSYICMIFLVLGSVKVLVDPTNNEHSVYVGLFLSGIILYGLNDNRLNLMWAGVYGSMALVSFLGLINWVNYLNGENINLYMCLWDLLIGVCFAYESDLYVD